MKRTGPVCNGMGHSPRSSSFTFSLPPSTPNVLSKPIPANLLPLNLLPRNRQLSPERLERALIQASKRLVQLLLKLLLLACDFPHNLGGTRAAAHRRVDRLVRQEPYVSILVVVHVDVYAAGESAGRGRVEVGGAPTAVPVVGGAVFVGHRDEGEGAVRGRGVDAVGGGGVVFGCMCAQRVDNALDEVGMGALDDMTLHRTRLAALMVKVKRTLCLHVVVPALGQFVVFANKHLRRATRQLGGGKLRLIVFLKRRPQFARHGLVAEYGFDSFGDVGKLIMVNGGNDVSGGQGTSPGGALSMKEERAVGRDMLPSRVGMRPLQGSDNWCSDWIGGCGAEVLAGAMP